MISTIKDHVQTETQKVSVTFYHKYNGYVDIVSLALCNAHYCLANLNVEDWLIVVNV